MINKYYLVSIFLLFFLFLSIAVAAQSPGDVTGIEIDGQQLILQTESGAVIVEAIAENVVDFDCMTLGEDNYTGLFTRTCTYFFGKPVPTNSGEFIH